MLRDGGPLSRRRCRGLAHGSNPAQAGPRGLSETLSNQRGRQVFGDRDDSRIPRLAAGHRDEHVGCIEETGKQGQFARLLPDSQRVLENESRIARLDQCTQQARTLRNRARSAGRVHITRCKGQRANHDHYSTADPRTGLGR